MSEFCSYFIWALHGCFQFLKHLNEVVYFDPFRLVLKPSRQMTSIQRRLNVDATSWHSMERHDVASTLRRHCINVVCQLGTIIKKIYFKHTPDFLVYSIFVVLHRPHIFGVNGACVIYLTYSKNSILMSVRKKNNKTTTTKKKQTTLSFLCFLFICMLPDRRMFPDRE